VILGVIAGVSARLPSVKSALEQRKQDYYAFYVREIIGSKSQLPRHISRGLHDFFDTFPTLEELEKEIIPATEKALLRAPEMVLKDVVPETILSLPESMDLSGILHAKLLKPLLSNLKSTNAALRAGALRTFQVLASRSYDDTVKGKLADELLTPLKQGKVTTADQKVLHAQMLSSLRNSISLAQKIPAAIAAVALKEPNEPAVAAEVSSMMGHLIYGLKHGIDMEKAVTDAVTKGMADKRIPVRRLWAIRSAEIWWQLSPGNFAKPDILAFCQATLPMLVTMWQDVVANPIPATQSGMVTVGHFTTAILLSRAQLVQDEKVSAVVKKADAISQSLAMEPKPSFLLNPRVYTKLSSAEDIEIALHAFTAIVPWLSNEKATQGAREAWAQALIYFIVAQNLPSKAKAAAKQALTHAYMQTPAEISDIMIQGLWLWYKSSQQGDKESAAVASKSGTTDLYAVLHSFCLTPEYLNKAGTVIAKDTLRKQCANLLLLARPEIIPRASWIDTCLKIGVDPGQLVRDHLQECIASANDATLVGTRTPPAMRRY
jgi:hypothetical protein